MREWEFLTEEDLLALHKSQIEEYGGRDGIRDIEGVKAAALRPMNIMAYNPDADLFDLASAVFFSITRNRHPFVDGNKRVGFAACDITLMLNDYQLDVNFSQAFPVIMNATTGNLTEGEFSAWLRENSSLNEKLRNL